MDSVAAGSTIDVLLTTLGTGAKLPVGQPAFFTGRVRREARASGTSRDTVRLTLVEVMVGGMPKSGIYGTFVTDLASEGADRRPVSEAPEPGHTTLRGLVAEPIPFVPLGRSALARVPALPPDYVPALVDDHAQFVPLIGASPGLGIREHRSVLLVHFESETPQAERAAVIVTIGGRVIGGEPARHHGDGPYYVQVADDPTGARNLQLGAWLDQLPGVVAAYVLGSGSANNMAKTRQPSPQYP